MGARIIADRSLLLSLWLQHPDWTTPTLAQATGRSVAWVKKCKARFRTAAHPEDAVWGRSHPQAPGSRCSAATGTQIVPIRDDPPEQLHRTPGPKAILYSLPLCPELRAWTASGCHARRAPSGRSLCAAERIAHRPRRPRSVQERPAPLGDLQRDCTEVVQVDALVSTKQAHAGAVWDAVEVGTSLWLLGAPRVSSTAETVFGPLLTLLFSPSCSHPPGADRPPRARPRFPAIRGCWAAPGCTTFPAPSCASGMLSASGRWSTRRIGRT